MQGVSKIGAFALRRTVECPSCGSDEIRPEKCGRDVCSDCGIVVPGGSNISGRPPATNDATPNEPVPSIDPIAISSPVRRVREMHPGCAESALEFARKLPPAYVRGMTAPERVRHSQALAYLAYRDAGQTRITVARLATQIRVPEERLSKDVRALADALGIRGWTGWDDGSGACVGETDESGDVTAFSRAVLGVLKPGVLARGRTVRAVHSWCRDVFRRAISAGEVELANLAPKHQADAAIAVYCRARGSPFAPGVYGPPKRDRRGVPESETATALRALTRVASARKAADALGRHVSRR